MIADLAGVPTPGPELDAAVARHLNRLRAEGKLDRFMRQEPRCRVCADHDVRRLVNRLLAYTPMGLRLADIVRILEPVNEGRSIKERITYDCLWVHSRRHFNFRTPAVWIWRAIELEWQLRNALGSHGVSDLQRSHSGSRTKYEENEPL